MITGKEQGKEARREVDLFEYWRIFLKRKWVVISFASLVIIIIGIFTFTATPLYRASTNLVIEEPSSNMLNIQEMFNYSSYPRYDYLNQYFNTQLRLLTSRSLAERVAQKMNLGRREELLTSKNSKKSLIRIAKDIIKSFIPVKLFSSQKKSKPPQPEPRFQPNPNAQLAFLVLGGLSVTPIEETRVVKVSYTSPYPVLAADIVNTLSEEFINYSIETRYEATQQASEFLANQTVQLREELASKERALQKYGEEKKIFFLNEKESTVLSKFADLNEAFTQAQIERIKKEAGYRELKGLKVDDLPPYVNNPLIQNMKEDYMRSKSEYKEKGEKFKPEYPEMLNLRAKIEGMREELEGEIRKAVEASEAEYRSALNKEKSLEALLDSQREDVINMNSNAILYNSLQIDVENKRMLLNSLVAKQNETLVSARLSGLKTSNIRIVDKALVPGSPVSPNKKRNLMWAMFLGIFGGLGMMLLVEYLDNTVKGPEEVEKLTGLPSLGIIPFYHADGQRRRGYYGRYYSSKYYSRYDYRGYKGYYKGDSLKPDLKNIELINHLYPKFFIAEDYRTLRTSLLLSQGDRKARVFCFLSALPKEGKTANVVNAAVSFSQLEKRVLLIDGDLRKPRCHKVFKVKNKEGLSSYLIGNAGLAEAVRKTAIDNLYLIPCGPKPPNPAELLNSQRMKELIQEAKEKFDFVLIDSPPIMAVIDGVITSSVADGAVFIIQAGKTPRKAFLKSVEKLRNSNVHIIGVLFNEARIEKRSSYYNSYYQYHYYYSGEDEKGPNGRKPLPGKKLTVNREQETGNRKQSRGSSKEPAINREQYYREKDYRERDHRDRDYGGRDYRDRDRERGKFRIRIVRP